MQLACAGHAACARGSARGSPAGEEDGRVTAALGNGALHTRMLAF